MARPRPLLVWCLVVFACDGRIEARAVDSASGGGAGGGTSQPERSTCVPDPRAEPLPLRRLTRTEYDNTVREVLRVPQPTFGDRLPTDEKTGLFLNNLSGSVSRSMLEQYERIAEELTSSVSRLRASVDACDIAIAGEATCAERFIAQFGHRAFRRPLAAEEQARYQSLYAAHRANGTFDDGVTFVARAMLQSPNFLYHFDESRAARLSYFLWNGAPDAELLEAQQSGALATPAGFSAQVDRLLADDRAQASLRQFHLQLLGVDGARVPNKSPALYPAFDAAAYRAMLEEAARFVDHVVRRDDGTLSTLLTAAYSVSGDGQRVPLEPTRSAGLLTQPAVLAGLANTDTTSPVRRGVMIRRNLMCQNLPDPPPGAPTLVPPAMGQETTRQRVVRVTSQSTTCSSCHSFINDVGFGFEQYGPLGEWRSTDNGLPIDASGVLTGTVASDGPFSGARALATRLAAAREVQDCYTKQWLRFALARVEQPRDACELQELSDAFAQSGGDIRGLLRRIAASRAFAFDDLGTPSGAGGGSAGGGVAGGGSAGGMAAGGVVGGGSAGGTATGGGLAGGGGSAGGTTVTTLLMASGALLRPNEFVVTADGTHRLVYQLDGNLVLYRTGGGAVMSSGTVGTTPGLAVMQGDGNFVVYDAAGVARFNTVTHGNPGAALHFDAGRLHIIAPSGTRLWSSP